MTILVYSCGITSFSGAAIQFHPDTQGNNPDMIDLFLLSIVMDSCPLDPVTQP